MGRSGLIALAMFGVTAAHAGAIDDVSKMQKNGMWEMQLPGQKGAPLLFCVTDAAKIGGLEKTREAMKSLGCKTERDVLTGDQYEIELACAGASPDVGSFRMVTKGTARADYQKVTTTVTGGGKMIQMLFPKETVGENRWVRPCRPDEKPGPQEKK